MKKYLNILKKCPLFWGVDDQNLIIMLNCLGARVDFYDKKYTVFAENRPVKYIGIVLSGEVQTVQVDYYGNRSILNVIEPSQVFAEEFACADVVSLPVSIIASEPSEIMLIECSHILHTCSNGCGFHHQLIFNLMKNLASKTIMYHQRIDITAKRTTREKLMAYLMLCAQKNSSNTFVINLDRQELADYLEVDRSGLSAEIGKLKKEGVIDCRKNHFTLLKRNNEY